MKNKCFKRDIFGTMLTQKMAQKALPILVAYAKEDDTIILADLATEIAPHLTQFNFAMISVFKWIQTTLYKLERQDDWEYGEIPGLTAIAVAAPETPTNAMIERTRVDPNTPLSWEDYKTHHVLPVWEYRYWDQVMDFVTNRI